jgi:hypothetical protein
LQYNSSTSTPFARQDPVPISKSGNNGKETQVTFQVPSSDNGTYTLGGLDKILDGVGSSIQVNKTTSQGPFSLLSNLSVGKSYTYSISYVAAYLGDRPVVAGSAQIQVDP